MNTLKFKVWDNVDYMSRPFTLQDLQAGKIKFTEGCTVLQFTGLKDREGREYCEGDIVVYEGKKYRIARGTYSFFVFGFYKASQDEPTDFFAETAYREAVIVGNFYQTPQLLNNE